MLVQTERIVFLAMLMGLVLISLLLFLQVRSIPCSPEGNSALPPSSSSSSLTQPIDHRKLTPQQEAWKSLSHLVLVACHAVYIGDDFDNITSDAAWYLESYQKSQVATFVEHIRKGVQLVAEDKNALLLFSGGATRKDAGPRVESQSYWLVSEFSDWFGYKEQKVRERVGTEEFARDSFENLLFSVCRFYEMTGHYPRKISIVSFDFKQKRFVDLHRAAIRYPLENVEFYGIDPPEHSTATMRSYLQEQEENNALFPFSKDPYGCREPLLSKKQSRNPFLRTHPYLESCPHLSKLLSYRSNTLYSEYLPWDY